MRRLIASSNGVQTAGALYVAAAQANDGSFMLIYAPTTSGGGVQTFTVDTRSMAGTSNCRWYDPTGGGYQPASPVTVNNAQSAQSFSTPGTNSAGDNDWFLVLS